MDTIVTRAPNSPRRSWRTVGIAVAIGAVVVAGFFALDGLVREPDVVPRITVRNRSADLIEVFARGDAGSDLVPVAVVEPERSAVAYDVVDQGERWTFVVEVSGGTVAKLHRTRSQLERASWTVVVPDTVGATAGG